MIRTQSSKLIIRYGLWLLLVFILMGLSYLFISLTLSNHYLQQVQTRIHIHVADSIIEDHRLVDHGRLDKEAISSVFRHYMLLNPHLEIYLLDLQGNILEYAADAKKIKRSKIDIAPVIKHIQGNNADFLYADDPRKMEGQKPFSAAYLPNKEAPESILYVIIQDSIEQEANRQLQESILLELSGWSFLSSLFIGLLLSGLIFYRLTNRVTKLTNKVEHFKQQPGSAVNYPAQLSDEIDQLDQTFAEMSIQIQQQIARLEKNDRQRRFMISGLSHDLRTPLTNMLGYMELLQQQASPNEYLTIAYQNGQKLKHYLDQLFEYSKLDVGGVEPALQKLSLSEFCFDIIQHYQANYPDTLFHTEIATDVMQMFDPNQLERAIRNLLDNAIKHGQGEITFALRPSLTEAKISICDQGVHIDNPITTEPKHNQSGGLGLGLIIVESIIKKHHGELDFESGEQGNCFTLTLVNTVNSD